MPFTPAHVVQARAPSVRSLHPRDLIRVRTLYFEKRFKHCIAACEELLEQTPSTPVTPTFAGNAPSSELHPVHRAFLVFHQAISYECIGLAAHKYSQNKLRFLESAQQNFKAALDILPQPFANAEDGCPLAHTNSPVPPDLSDDASHDEDDASSVDTATAKVNVEDLDLERATSTSDHDVVEVVDTTESTRNLPLAPVSRRLRSTSEASSMTSDTDTTVSQAFTVPSFDDYSPRQDLVGLDDQPAPVCTTKPPTFRGRLPRTTPFLEVESGDFHSSDDDEEPDHLSGWLPRSMRSLNLAAHDLSSEGSESTVATPTKALPCNINGTDEGGPVMPVTSVTPLTKAMASLRYQPTVNPMHTNRLSASLSSSHVLCEELIPSPLFKKSNKIGAVSFEDVVSSPRPLPRTPHLSHNHLSLLPRKTAVQTLISRFEGTLPSPASSYITATPPTSAASQTALCTPITPRFNIIHDCFDPNPQHLHLKAYLTSRSLANYNAQLTSFRTCLLTASDQIAELLETAEDLQQQHEREKRAVAPRVTPGGLPTNRLASMWLLSIPGKPTSVRARGGKGNNEKHGPSPSRARMLGRSESLRNRKKLPLLNRVEESEEKRAERIEKLRKNGFRVNKERCGWKGEEYYESFRRKVEMELSR